MGNDQATRDTLHTPPGTNVTRPTVGINEDVDIFGDPNREGGEGGAGSDHATNFYGTGTDDLRAGIPNDPSHAPASQHAGQPGAALGGLQSSSPAP